MDAVIWSSSRWRSDRAYSVYVATPKMVRPTTTSAVRARTRRSRSVRRGPATGSSSGAILTHGRWWHQLPLLVVVAVVAGVAALAAVVAVVVVVVAFAAFAAVVVAAVVVAGGAAVAAVVVVVVGWV